MLESQLCVCRCLSLSYFLGARYHGFTLPGTVGRAPSAESWESVTLADAWSFGIFLFISEQSFIFSILGCCNCKDVVEDDKRDEHIHEFGRGPQTAADCDLFHVF